MCTGPRCQAVARREGTGVQKLGQHPVLLHGTIRTPRVRCLLGVKAVRLQVPDLPLYVLRGRPDPPENSPARVSPEGTAASLSQRGGGGQAGAPWGRVSPQGLSPGPPAPAAAPGSLVICEDSWSPNPHTPGTPCHAVPSRVVLEPSTTVPHLLTSFPHRPQGLRCPSQVSPQPPTPQPWGRGAPAPLAQRARRQAHGGGGFRAWGVSCPPTLGSGGRQTCTARLCLRKDGAAARLAQSSCSRPSWAGVGSPHTQPLCQRPCVSRVPRGCGRKGRAGRGLLPSRCVGGAAGQRLAALGPPPCHGVHVQSPSWCMLAVPVLSFLGSPAVPGSAWTLTTRSGLSLPPRTRLLAHCPFPLPNSRGGPRGAGAAPSAPCIERPLEVGQLPPAPVEERMSEEGRARRVHGHGHVGLQLLSGDGSSSVGLCDGGSPASWPPGLPDVVRGSPTLLDLGL